MVAAAPVGVGIGVGPVGIGVGVGGPYPDDYADNNGYYDGSYGPDYAYGPDYGYYDNGYGPGFGVGFNGGYDNGGYDNRRAQAQGRLRNIGAAGGQNRAVAADPGTMNPNRAPRMTPGGGGFHARAGGHAAAMHGGRGRPHER